MRPSHPALNVRDDAYAPLGEAGPAHSITISEKTKEKFCLRAADGGDRFESLCKKWILAHETSSA
jgi:hypothetical protein